jgi:HD-GYP domain-containing protein (c-di-GMP phosphodiesterase class II)
VDRVVFAPGLGRSEVAAFIEDLARLEASPVTSRGHVRISRVASVGGAQEGAAAGPTRLLDVHERIAVMSQLVSAAAGDEPVPWATVHGIVEQLDRRMVEAADAMTLLAPLGDEEEWHAVHAHNTTALSLALGAVSGLDAGQRHDLGVAAAVHDLGKFAIPMARVRQEFDLAGTEWELSFDHPQRGLDILLAAPEAPELARVVVFDHHLRADGQGFPSLPAARSPHRAAALVAVAEAFDIMHTVRWTRGSIGPEEIGELLIAGAGTALEPAPARAMLAIWQASGESF